MVHAGEDTEEAIDGAQQLP
jgi:hypothetical protein